MVLENVNSARHYGLHVYMVYFVTEDIYLKKYKKIAFRNDRRLNFKDRRYELWKNKKI